MSEFPKRTENHKKESSSWKVMESKIDSDWIIRQVTERDYGVDAYIEIVLNDGLVTGDICFIQLKSSDSIKWVNGRAKLSGIKKSTINYWMSIPAPVYIFWVDLLSNKLFFSPVKDTIRNTYKEFLENSITMTIPFVEKDEIDTEVGDIVFLITYLREKTFHKLVSLLRLLIFHSKEYFKFIILNQGRDWFLPVEEEIQIELVHLYTVCKELANYYLIDWDVTNLNVLYQKDAERWDDGYDLHEDSLTIVLSELEVIFFKVLEASKEMITGTQKYYWKSQNRLIYSMFQELDIEGIKLSFQ